MGFYGPGLVRSYRSNHATTLDSGSDGGLGRGRGRRRRKQKKKQKKKKQKKKKMKKKEERTGTLQYKGALVGTAKYSTNFYKVSLTIRSSPSPTGLLHFFLFLQLVYLLVS